MSTTIIENEDMIEDLKSFGCDVMKFFNHGREVLCAKVKFSTNLRGQSKYDDLLQAMDQHPDYEIYSEPCEPGSPVFLAFVTIPIST